MIVDFSSAEDIRAALGVSSDDIVDEVIQLRIYEDGLVVELESVNLTLPATYDSIKAQDTHTDTELRFLRAARLFATYAVAKQLTTSLPMFSVKQVTDSKAGITRFDNPYAATISEVIKNYGSYKQLLAAALGVITSTSKTPTVRQLVRKINPSYDPVTGK